MDQQSVKFKAYIQLIVRNKVVKDYGAVVFTLVAVAILIIFAIKPTVEAIIKLHSEIAVRQETLDKVRSKSESLSKARDNLDQMDLDTKNKLGALVPNANSYPCLIDQLSNVAFANNLALSGIQFESADLEGPSTCIIAVESLGDLVKNPTVKELEFTINAQGSYSDFIAFLDDLNSLNRLIYISSLNFNRQQEGPIVMTVNAKAFYFSNTARVIDPSAGGAASPTLK